jgi:hypothetical protein
MKDTLEAISGSGDAIAEGDFKGLLEDGLE